MKKYPSQSGFEPVTFHAQIGRSKPLGDHASHM
jgi:hypothetical protein